MEIDEAIIRAEEVAEINEEDAKAWTRDGWQSAFKKLTPEKEAELKANRVILADNCAKCAEEYRQLAEWLKELKRLREQGSKNVWRSKPLPRATHCLVAIKWAPDDIEVTEADTTFLLKEHSERIIAWMPLPDPPKGGDS